MTNKQRNYVSLLLIMISFTVWVIFTLMWPETHYAIPLVYKNKNTRFYKSLSITFSSDLIMINLLITL
jgi:hypothetical protein